MVDERRKRKPYLADDLRPHMQCAVRGLPRIERKRRPEFVIRFNLQIRTSNLSPRISPQVQRIYGRESLLVPSHRGSTTPSSRLVRSSERVDACFRENVWLRACSSMNRNNLHARIPGRGADEPSYLPA